MDSCPRGELTATKIPQKSQSTDFCFLLSGGSGWCLGLTALGWDAWKGGSCYIFGMECRGRCKTHLVLNPGFAILTSVTLGTSLNSMSLSFFICKMGRFAEI